MRYAVSKLTYDTQEIQLSITPTSGVIEGEVVSEAWMSFEIQRGTVDCETAPLLFVPKPETGLSHIQVQEQTTYDVWLSWDSNTVPQLFLGDSHSPLPMKCAGTQAYIALNWDNYVGTSSVRVRLAGRDVVTLPVEVRSRKMGYLDDYRVMLDDISERLAALVFDYGSPTSVYAARRTQDTHVAYLDYLFLRYMMDAARLPLHFRLVVADPHRTMVREMTWRELSQVQTVTPRTLQTMVAHPERLARPHRQVAPVLQKQLQGHAPSELLDERAITTFDTPPNRFIKHFLTQLIQKLYDLQACFATEPHATALAQDCARWRRELNTLARAHFLEAVGTMHVYPAGSQVLLKREGYRQLNNYYRRFLLTGKVMWEGLVALLRTPNKDLATLYEYWCFFQVLDAVAAALDTPINPRSFIIERDGVFRVTLDTSGKSQEQIGAVTVYYNRYFRHLQGESYSVPLHPDYVVTLPDGRRFIFDAKYKYEHAGQFMTDTLDTDEERAETERLVYKKGDLYKMHTYRDALGAQAVFILYPGTEFRAYGIDGTELKKPEHITASFEGVGALDMQIGNTSTLWIILKALIKLD